MIDIPGRIKFHALHLTLNRRFLGQVYLSCGATCLFDIFKRAAQTSTSLTGMSSVVSHAKPAELMFALATCHMHAPLILFNRIFAFWTLFCIQFNPILCVFVAPTDSVEPLIQELAVHGSMSKFIAQETEICAALITGHIAYLIQSFLLNHLCATNTRTIFEYTVVESDIGLTLKVYIFIVQFLGQQLSEVF